jgi:2-desacetyl-2-hydroxyethyl bacteriochlorophyllide A dehydrogenase
MKAVLFPAPETISIEYVPDPACSPDEVVVQVASCGICGTDLHIYRNEYMSDFPLIPGHEFSGRVVEVGSAVTDLAIGDRVAVDPNLDCGHCTFCLDDMANHCLNWVGVGITRPGGFAEYVAVPARACYRLPASLTDTQAAFIEPLACVVYALKRLRVWPGNQVLIFGAGPMGLLLLQALQHSGAARVVMVEKQPQRLALAARMGGVPVDANQAIAEQLHELAPYGFEIVIDATGAPAVIEGAFAYLRPRGQYLQFGVTPMDATVNVSSYDIFRKDWTIIGSFAASHTFQPAIAWLANGVVDIAPLVSHTVPMDSFVDAFHQFARGETLKVHIEARSDT